MQLKSERVQKEYLLEQHRLQKEQLQISAPKVDYFDKVLTSQSTYTVTQIANELGLTAKALNRVLHKKKVQYLQNEQWVLYASFLNKGFTKTKTYSYTDKYGEQQTAIQTVWTEKGRVFIHTIIRG